MSYIQILPNLLLDNVSADTTGEPIRIPSGGDRIIELRGDLGGGVFTIEIKDQNDTDSEWLAVQDEDGNPWEWSSPTDFRISLGEGQLIRGKLAGSTGASGVIARIF